MILTEQDKQNLIEQGRGDLVEIYEINQSGFAGVMPNGNIVDRRRKLEAIPVQQNRLMNLPQSKQVTSLDVLNLFLPQCFEALLKLGLEHSIHSKICDLINEQKQKYSS